MLSLETYDGTKDPLDHLESFKTLMLLQGVPGEIMCRAFPTTMKGPARVWFSKIKPNSMSTFKELSNSFITHFIEGQMHKHSTHALMQIKQREDESLRSYVAQFNKEALLIDDADGMALITAFSNELKEGEFLFSMLKNEPKTMADMHFKATKYMNVEDALIACKDNKGKRKRESAEDTQPNTREKNSQYEGKRDNREARPSSGRIINFTPLNTPLDQVLMQISDNPTLNWPEKLKGDLDKRSRGKYCHFHHDHGHNIFKYYELKSQVEALIRKGKLQRFIRGGPRIQPLQGLK